MNSIVIARYNESLDWILQIPPEFEIFIYNKGEKVTAPHLLQKAHHIIDRPNTGRESETYVHHMLTNLKAGNGFTVFAQGDPMEHSPDFLKILANWHEWDDLQPMTWRWRADREVPPKLLLDAYEQKLQGRLRIRPEWFSLQTWAPTIFFDVGASNTGIDYRRIHGDLPEGTNIAAHFLRNCQLYALADKAEASAFGVFCYGAMFAVRNDLVRQVPTASIQLIQQASNAAATYGYVLERLWLHLFGADFSLQASPSVPTENTQNSDTRPASPSPVKAEQIKPVASVAAVEAAIVASQGMTEAEKVAVLRITNDLAERIRDRDFYMVSEAWRYHGGDAALLNFYEIQAKSPMIWSEAKPDFWLIYICVLLENGRSDLALNTLRKYRLYHGDKLIENYLPIVPFALQSGVMTENLKKASYVRDCFAKNQASNLLERHLQGKRVAIVGNGPSELGKGRGAEIDSHDIVIRFNNYATKGFERDYGTKTDIWIRGSGGNDIVDRVDVDGYKLIVWEADYQHFPIHFDDLQILHRYLQSDREKCAYFDFDTHFSLREECGIPFPSTGLVAFWKMYNLLGKVISDIGVYGFAFLEDNPSYSHPHYFHSRDEADAKRRSEVHYPAREAAFMKSLVRMATVDPMQKLAGVA